MQAAMAIPKEKNKMEMKGHNQETKTINDTLVAIATQAPAGGCAAGGLREAQATAHADGKIGRASCRERVSSPV